MLQLILGPSGSGKTTVLRRRLARRIQDVWREDALSGAGEGRRDGQGGNGRLRSILIVPEQYSFESEKALHGLCGDGPQGGRFLPGAEVLSFSRLALWIFRQLGGLAGEYLDDSGKQLLMSVALSQVEDQLEYYAKKQQNAAFVSSLLEAVEELKNAHILPEQLGELARSAPEEERGLREKSRELSLIYGTYQALLEQRYRDSLDDLARAAQLLKEESLPGGKEGLFRDTAVYIDGFKDFTGSEMQLLEQLLARSEDCTVALSCRHTSVTDPYGVFAPVERTAQRLIRTAKSYGVPVAAPLLLEGGVRFANPDLARLEAGLRDFPGEGYGPERGLPGEEAVGPSKESAPSPEPPASLSLIAAADPYEEVEAAAREMVRLVRREGWRFGEMAVIVRSMEEYRHPLETILPRYGIPCFMDQPSDAAGRPLFHLLLAGLETVRSGFDPEPALKVLKSGLAGAEVEDTALFENYCYVWSVKGEGFFQPFTHSPGGFSGVAAGLSSEEAAVLERINALRERVILPLVRLRDRLQGREEFPGRPLQEGGNAVAADGREASGPIDGAAFAAALYGWLEELDVRQALARQAGAFRRMGETALAEESEPLWNALVALLDQFATALRDIRLPLTRLSDLFRLCVSRIEVGKIPQTLDQVIAGAADRIRPDRPKGVFVLGAAEGVFPAQPTSGGIFSDADRRRLAQLGLELGNTAEEQLLNEGYFLYTALTCASHRVFVSYPMADGAGKSRRPSEIVGRLGRIFPGLRPRLPYGELEGLVNRQTAYRWLASRVREQTPAAQAVRNFLLRDPAGQADQTDYGRRLERLERPIYPSQYELRRPELARKLFGEEMRLSPTRLENYYSCPFSYFCSAGLKLSPRRRAELSPLETGSLLHWVLEQMVSRHGGRGLAALSGQQMRAEVEQALDQYLEERMGGKEDKSARFRYLYARLSATLIKLLRHLGEEFSQSEFEPYAFELPVSEEQAREGRGVAPIRLSLISGGSILLEGYVDRVDLMETGGEKYVRVVDYKSGGKTFRLSDVYYGLSLQMLVYLFSICENGTGRLAGALPAGVLYLPAQNVIPEMSREACEEEAARKNRETLKMNGLLLDNLTVVSGMEKEIAGLFIPAKLKRDGSFDAYTSVAGLAQLAQLRRHIEGLVIQMGESLRSGRIGAVPTVSGDHTPCEWCDFAAICRRGQSEPERPVERMSNREVFERLAEEESGKIPQ